MRRIALTVVVLTVCAVALQGCFFIYIPGSVIESVGNALSGKSRPGDADKIAQLTALEKATKFEDMLAYAQQWTAAEPDNATAWYVQGVAFMRLSRDAEAIASNRQAVGLRDVFPAAWNNLGFLALRQGDANEAIAACQKALSQQPEYALAWVNLGAAYNYKGDRDKVIDAYRHLQRIDPARAEAFSKQFRVS